RCCTPRPSHPDGGRPGGQSQPGSGGEMMTVHRQLARRWFDEVWNGRCEELACELLHPEAVGHLHSGDAIGVEPFLERFYRPFLAAFPDLHVAVEDILG